MSGISPTPDGQVRLDDPGRSQARRAGYVEAGPPPGPSEKIVGNIQGQELVQYDFTPQQYEALTKLTATLCTVFPKIKCEYPRDEAGALITHKLPEGQLASYGGVLGHFHVQTNKVDPGPAFQWDRVIGDARKLMSSH